MVMALFVKKIDVVILLLTESYSLSSIIQPQITTIVKRDPKYKFGQTTHAVSSSQPPVSTENTQSPPDIATDITRSGIPTDETDK